MTYQPPPQQKSRANLIAVVAIAALLVVGAVVAIIAMTSGDDSEAASNPLTTASANPADVKAAKARDNAIADGRAAVEVFNTVDYRSVEKDLDRWQSVATGDLLTELERGRDQNVAAVEQAKSRTTGTILDAALAEFDEEKGTARLLAAVSVEVTIEGQEPMTKRNPMIASLERTDDGWKISNLSTA